MYILLFLLQINCGLSFFSPFLHVNKYELSMKTTPVLLNGKYGGFGFSETFESEFEKEYNVSIPFFKSYFPDDNFNVERCKARYDERIINIYNRLGSESCEKYCSIFTEHVPDDLLPYIDITEYDGKETLTVNISKKYKDLLLEAIDNPDKRVSNDDFLEILNMKLYEKYLDDNDIEYL